MVQTAFFLGPVLAPLMGAAMVAVGSWRLTMAFGVAIAILGLIWSVRIAETLPEERRRSLGFGELLGDRRQIADPADVARG